MLIQNLCLYLKNPVCIIFCLKFLAKFRQKYLDISDRDVTWLLAVFSNFNGQLIFTQNSFNLIENELVLPMNLLSFVLHIGLLELQISKN